MSVIIEPTSVIKTKLGINQNGPVHKFFVSTCVKKMDKYIPEDLGNLRTIIDVSDNYVMYESPYAEYQYYGQRKDGSHVVKHYSTPGTGPYWDKRMVSAEMSDIEKEVQKYLVGER